MDVWRIAEEADIVNSTEVPSDECPGQRFSSSFTWWVHYFHIFICVDNVTSLHIILETVSWTVDSDQLMLLKLNAVFMTFETSNWLRWAGDCTLRFMLHYTLGTYPLIALSTNASVDQLF